MQTPSGQLYRLWSDGRLDRIIGVAASLNGVAVSREEPMPSWH